MKQNALLIPVIGTVIVEAVFYFIENDASSNLGTTWKIGIFILMPLALAVLIWLQLRWAAMACVFYATVGLAMDIATIVQVLTKDSDVGISLMANIVSGFFYFLLIVFGGRSFLGVDQGPTPLESRPPSPPFLS